MNTNVYTQAQVLDHLGRELELSGKTPKARRQQLEYVLSQLQYLHYRPGELRSPSGESRLRWKPRKWEIARSRYWLLEQARYEYYLHLALTNPQRFETDLRRIEISEGQLRRGRRVRLPGLPEGMLESWSWQFGVATIFFIAHKPVRRQIALVDPYLVRVDYRQLPCRLRRQLETDRRVA